MEFEGLADLIRTLDEGLDRNSEGAGASKQRARPADLKPSTELGRRYQAALFGVLDYLAGLGLDDMNMDEEEDDEEEDSEDESESPDDATLPLDP